MADTNKRKLSNRLHGLFVLIYAENEQVLKLVKEEKVAILKRRDELDTFPKNKTFGNILSWLFRNLFYRSSIRKQLEERIPVLDQIEEKAVLQKKKCEDIIDSIFSSSPDVIYARLAEFEREWYLKEIPKDERLKFVFFPLDVRLQNVADMMVDLRLAVESL